MQTNRPIQFKAIFLLLVFTTNTIVGFACSLGVNMGFNTNHHHDEQSQIAHHHSHTHHHDQHNVGHSRSTQEKGNCCNDEVIKFAQVDKSTTQNVKAGLSPLFFTTFLWSFYSIDLLHTLETPVTGKYFLRNYHPPIPDIRIAIQSFQI